MASYPHIFVKIDKFNIEKYKKIISWCKKHAEEKTPKTQVVNFLGTEVEVPELSYDHNENPVIKDKITPKVLKEALWENDYDNWEFMAIYVAEISFDYNFLNLHFLDDYSDNNSEDVSSSFHKSMSEDGYGEHHGQDYTLYLFADGFVVWAHTRGNSLALFSTEIRDKIKELAKLVEGELEGPNFF